MTRGFSCATAVVFHPASAVGTSKAAKILRCHVIARSLTIIAASRMADHGCLSRPSLSDLRAISITIDDAERQRIIEAIRTYMARERISREEFAQRAKLGKSTVDKLATGLFSERTILQIEARLNIKLREAGASTATAPPEYGSYTREEAGYFVGDYVFARPSFQEEGVIQAFHMEMAPRSILS